MHLTVLRKVYSTVTSSNPLVYLFIHAILEGHDLSKELGNQGRASAYNAKVVWFIPLLAHLLQLNQVDMFTGIQSILVGSV